MNDSVYLDAHAGIAPFPGVCEAFSRAVREYPIAVGAPHFAAQQGLFPLGRALENIFEIMGADPEDECFFWPKDIFLMKCFLAAYTQISCRTGRTRFVIGSTETGDRDFREIVEETGCVYGIPVRDASGRITAETLLPLLTSKTAWVSLPWADPLTGVIHPVEEIASLCKEKNILLHLDATYVFGKRFFRFRDLEVSFLTIDGGGIGSLPGTGIVLMKKEIPLVFLKEIPFFAPIAAMVRALELRADLFETYCLETGRIVRAFEEKICAGFPGALAPFREVDRLPDTAVIIFPGVHSDALLYRLNRSGIYASSGGGKFLPLAKILSESGIGGPFVDSAIAFCFPESITDSEAEATAEEIIREAGQLLFLSGGVS